MIRSITASNEGKPPLGMVLILISGILISLYVFHQSRRAPSFGLASAVAAGSLDFSYEVITSDIAVDWTGGGDFDPRGKCPQDFLSDGFIVIYKKLKDGACFKFLYHKGKQLLYRIDKDVINGKAGIGLHWVTGTAFNSRYRIADAAYKGGKTVAVPTAKGGKVPATFQYGAAVSKKRVQPGRELFRETHIQPGQCNSWWDIFNFMP